MIPLRLRTRLGCAISAAALTSVACQTPDSSPPDARRATAPAQAAATETARSDAPSPAATPNRRALTLVPAVALRPMATSPDEVQRVEAFLRPLAAVPLPADGK